MKKQLLVLIAFTLIIFTGCSKDDNSTPAESKFKGSWQGTYTGGDQGSVAVDVDAAGNLKGSSVSSRTLEVFAITGAVDGNGTFKGKTDIGTEFIGTFTQTSISGTWTNTVLKLNGTWTGSKKQ